MDERERRLLEKRYQLPDNPHIVIHPSRTAKSGKFFCNVMSLSILLDYRPEDTKEHSFEVSLFAELFNEMLMRDFGYNIYTALYAMPEKTKEVVEKEEEAEKEKEKESKRTADEPKDKKSKKDEDSKAESDGRCKDDVSDKMDTSEKDKSNDSTDKYRKKDSRDKDKERDRKRRREDDLDDDTFSVKSSDPKKKDKDRLKYYTADPDLLLSFVYFDQTHCGYIFEKDIEELFYTLGLRLSRAQTRKLVGKVVSRDSLFYRKLTDKPKEEKVGGDASAEKPAPVDAIEVVSLNVAELSKGNKAYLPVFKKDPLTSSSSSANHSSDNHADESNLDNGQVVETQTGS